MLQRIDTISSRATPSDLSTLIVALAQLGIKFFPGYTSSPSHSPADEPRHDNVVSSKDELPRYLDALVRLMPSMTAIELSTTLWALGKSGILWDSMPLRVQKSIIMSIANIAPALNPFCLASCIHGMF